MQYSHADETFFFLRPKNYQDCTLDLNEKHGFQNWFIRSSKSYWILKFTGLFLCTIIVAPTKVRLVMRSPGNPISRFSADRITSQNLVRWKMSHAHPTNLSLDWLAVVSVQRINSKTTLQTHSTSKTGQHGATRNLLSGTVNFFPAFAKQIFFGLVSYFCVVIKELDPGEVKGRKGPDFLGI